MSCNVSASSSHEASNVVPHFRQSISPRRIKVPLLPDPRLGPDSHAHPSHPNNHRLHAVVGLTQQKPERVVGYLRPETVGENRHAYLRWLLSLLQMTCVPPPLLLLIPTMRA